MEFSWGCCRGSEQKRCLVRTLLHNRKNRRKKSAAPVGASAADRRRRWAMHLYSTPQSAEGSTIETIFLREFWKAELEEIEIHRLENWVPRRAP